MHADQPVRRCERCADLLKRDSRGIGSHDGVRLHTGLGRGKDRLLDLQIFGHRLDQQIGIRQPVASDIGPKPRQRLLHLFGRFQTPLIQTARPLDGLVHGLGRNVLKRDGEPVHRGNCSDITTHCTSTDDMNVRDVMLPAPALLHHVGQLKIAPHASRGRCHHKLRKEFRFAFHHIVFVEF